MKLSLPILGVALAQPIALLIPAPVAAQDTVADMAKYVALPPSAYKGKITVTDNGGVKVIVTSQNAWQSPDAQSDMYLGATIDRNTKETRYYAYQAQKVMGDWAGYNKAHLTAPAGAVDIKVSYRDDTVLGCTDQCTMQELVAFPVDRTLLDQYAGRGTPPSDTLAWELKSSKGAKDAAGAVSVNEIKAFLAEVDTQRKKK